MGKYIHFLILVAGAGLLTAGVGIDGAVTIEDVPVLLGLVGLLVGLDLWFCRHRLKVAVDDDGDARYELGYRDGHREGYDKGRHARPVVVPFPAEKLCRDDVVPRGRHAARCRENCTAGRRGSGGGLGSEEWTWDGAG